MGEGSSLVSTTERSAALNTGLSGQVRLEPMDKEVAGQASGGGSCGWQQGTEGNSGKWYSHQRKPEHPKEWWNSTEVQKQKKEHREEKEVGRYNFA